MIDRSNIGILIIAETKIDSSFCNSQFMIEGFSLSFRIDRNRFGGGVKRKINAFWSGSISNIRCCSTS